MAVLAGFGFFSPGHRDVVLVQKWKRISHHGLALAARSFNGDRSAVIGIFLIRRGSLSALPTSRLIILHPRLSNHIRPRLISRTRSQRSIYIHARITPRRPHTGLLILLHGQLHQIVYLLSLRPITALIEQVWVC